MDLKGNAVTWLGHGTWLWETASGQRILIDPFLENSPTCPEEHKQISGLDTILVTHGHIDHVADLIGRVDPEAVTVVRLGKLHEIRIRVRQIRVAVPVVME